MRPGLHETYHFDPWQGYEGDFGPPSPPTFVAAPWLSQGRPPPARGLVGPAGMQGAVGRGAIGNGYDPGSIHGVIGPDLSIDELMRRAAQHSQRVFVPPRRF